MKSDVFNDCFLNAIREKIHPKTAIATRLADILDIEKEAIYRRLRGEVCFTFNEVVRISKKLGISIDGLVGSDDEKSKPFYLKLVDFNQPGKEDYEILEYMLRVNENTTDFTDSEYGAAMNMIPMTLAINYDYIFRFYIYKWKYQNQHQKTLKSFAETQLHPGVYERTKLIPRIAAMASTITYIWDEMILHNLIKDILYFNTIGLISDEEKKKIREDLILFIDDLEILAVKGVNGFGNKVNIYISNVSFESSYSFVETKNFNLTMITVFTLNQVTSIDEESYLRIKQFVQSVKRTSTLISESGEIYRIQFFEKQKKIIDRL